MRRVNILFFYILKLGNITTKINPTANYNKKISKVRFDIPIRILKTKNIQFIKVGVDSLQRLIGLSKLYFHININEHFFLLGSEDNEKIQHRRQTSIEDSRHARPGPR